MERPSDTDSPEPLVVALTGHRRILLDVHETDWRCAFYYPERYACQGAHPKIVTLEKRARTGSEKDQIELKALRMARGAGRASELRHALRKAMTVVQTDRWGATKIIAPSEREVEQIARYVLDGRYAERHAVQLAEKTS